MKSFASNSTKISQEKHIESIVIIVGIVSQNRNKEEINNTLMEMGIEKKESKGQIESLENDKRFKLTMKLVISDASVLQ